MFQKEGFVVITDELLSVAQLARELGVHRATVGRWIAEGRLEHLRLPGGRLRVPRRALEAMTILVATPK